VIYSPADVISVAAPPSGVAAGGSNWRGRELGIRKFPEEGIFNREQRSRKKEMYIRMMLRSGNSCLEAL